MIDDLRARGQNKALCLLIACAMQLGCNIPDRCRQGLALGGLPSEGKVRFAKALRDYRNGISYPFNSKGLYLTMSTGSPSYDESEIFWMGLEDVPAGEEITQANTTIERVHGDFNQPVDVCGNCGTSHCDDGSELKRCTGCKERYEYIHNSLGRPQLLSLSILDPPGHTSCPLPWSFILGVIH